MKIINLYSRLKRLNKKKRFSYYRKLWHRVGNYEILTDFPLHLDIELAGVCNLRCDFCFQNGLITKPLGFMDMELYTKIIDEGVNKGLCAIKLQIRGESFMHPRLFDCIRYAKDAGIMDVQITTNGTLLDNERIQEIFDSGLDGIIFSFDQRHLNSYMEKYRVSNYLSLEQAINKFLQKRAELGASRPWVRIQAAVTEDVADSIYKTENYLKEKFPLANIISVNKVFDFREDRESYKDLHTRYKMLPCGYLTQRLSIFWDGSIAICCMDYNCRFNIGNVNSQTVKDIWLSDQMMQFREIHRNNKRSTMIVCNQCHNYCLADKKGIESKDNSYISGCS